MTMRAVQIKETGGPEVMQLVSIPLPILSPGQALVKISHCTVNFVDTYHRNGLYPVEFPCTLGCDGVGVIESFGPDADDVDYSRFSLGERVAFTLRGAYAEYIAASLAKLVKVPEGISDSQAAASMVNDLCRDVHRITEGDTILVHAIAGGTGQWICQLAKKFGATVIGTCSTAEKAELALSLGADHIINYRETPDFAAEVAKIAPELCQVVYDGVGLATWEGSIKCVKPRGILCVFGNASGPVPPIDPLDLTKQGSIFLTRPSMFHYCKTAEETQLRADDLFRWISEGMAVNICKVFSMTQEDVRASHVLIESRGTLGKILIRVGEESEVEGGGE